MKKLTLVNKVKKDMIKDGFKNPSREEMRLYHIFGSKQFNKIIQDAFEYAWNESKFLELQSGSYAFVELCKIRRRSYIAEILDDVDAMVKQRPEKRVFVYESPTREEINSLIEEEYKIKRRMQD